MSGRLLFNLKSLCDGSVLPLYSEKTSTEVEV